MATVQTLLPPLYTETTRSPDPERRSSFPAEQGSAEREDRRQRRTSLNSRPQLLVLGTPAAKEASKSFWTAEMLQQQLDKVVQCAEREKHDRLTSQTSLDSSVDSGAVSPKLPHLELPVAHARVSRSAPPTPPASGRKRTHRPLMHLSPPARLGASSSPPSFSIAPRTGSLQSIAQAPNSIGYQERITPPFLSPRLVKRAHTAHVRPPLAPTLSLEGKQAKLSPKLVPLRKSSSLNFSPNPVIARRDNRLKVLRKQESAEDDGFCE